MDYPKVSIVIPCKNEEAYIQKNIDSILSQNYSGEIEVLVVDGMSTDRTVEIVQDYNDDNIKLIENPRMFTPYALNLGIENSTGEYFIILGGHAYLEPDFVKNCIDNFLHDKTLGCVGGQILNKHINELSAAVSDAMASKFGVGGVVFRTGGKKQFVDTVAFGCYPKSIVDEIGYFDEELVRNQDDEFNFRVTKKGYKILFDPSIISHYYVRASLQKLWKQYYQYGYWKVYVGKKHKAVTTIRQLIPFLFVSGIITGAVLCVFIPKMWIVYLAGIGLYFLLSFVFAYSTASKKRYFPKIALVFWILHFSYGLGYLFGIINFIFFNKKPSGRSKQLSR
ncbi:MAG: glycosyltransferase family 2 protein [Crocinitomicaceae bacterium]|nr:glycosyltransferase family 2 protein [Crocinitomicaceae bacterium]